MTWCLTVGEALEAILDDDFGLSDGESSDEEGEDIYGYIGEPVLHCTDVEEKLGEAVVDGPFSDHDGNDGDLSDSGERGTSPERAQSNADCLESSHSSAEESVTGDNLAIVQTQVSLTSVFGDIF